MEEMKLTTVSMSLFQQNTKGISLFQKSGIKSLEFISSESSNQARVANEWNHGRLRVLILTTLGIV